MLLMKYEVLRAKKQDWVEKISIIPGIEPETDYYADSLTNELSLSFPSAVKIFLPYSVNYII